MKVNWWEALWLHLALLIVAIATSSFGGPWWAAAIVGGLVGWFWPRKVIVLKNAAASKGSA